MPVADNIEQDASQPALDVQQNTLDPPKGTADAFSGVQPQQDAFQNLTQAPTESLVSPPSKDAPQIAALAGISPGPSAMDDWKKATDDLQQTMAIQGEETTRSGIALQAKQGQVAQYQELAKSAMGIDPTGSLLKGAIIAGQTLQQEDDAKRSQYVVEQKAAQKAVDLAASGDTVEASVLVDNMKFGGPLQVLQDTNAKQMILQREIDKAGISVKDQGWAADVIDFVAGQHIPWLNTPDTGNIDLTPVVHRWYDSVLGGQRQSSEAASLWALPVSQFQQVVRDQLLPNALSNSTILGYQNQTSQLNILSRFMSTPSATEQNIWDTADNIGAVTMVPGIGKLARLPMLLVKSGARSAATQMVADAAKSVAENGVAETERVTGLGLDDIHDALRPSAINPEAVPETAITGGTDQHVYPPRASTVPELDVAGGADNYVASMPDIDLVGSTRPTTVVPKFVPPAVDINQLINKTTTLTQANNFIGSGRLTAEETETARASLEKHILEQTQSALKDVSYSKVHLSDGSIINRSTLTLGQEEGGGWATNLGAREAATGWGYSDVQIIRDASGQHFVQITRDLPENMFYTNPLLPQAKGSFSAHTLNARLLGDKLLGDQAQLAGNQKSAFLDNVIKPYIKTIHKISSSQREMLGQVMMAGESAGKWFTEDELHAIGQRALGRPMSDGEIAAYHAMHELNDHELVIRQDDLYKRLSTQGYETVSFDTGIGNVDRRNAIVNRSPSTAPEDRSFDVSSGIHFTKQNLLTESKLEALKARGAVHVRMQEPVSLADGTTVKDFFVSPKDAEFENLRRQQIGYREGGHRIYSGKNFVKQASEGTQADTGEKFLHNPNTYIATETKAEADQWASRMESARNMYKNGSSDAEISNALTGDPGMPSVDEFRAGLESGLYSKDYPFESLYDRELPSIYSRMNTDIADYADREATGTDGYLRTNGRLFYSSKGDQLKDYHGALAKTVDPYRTLNQSLTNVANLASFSDYKEAVIKRWVNTFKEFTNYDDMPQGVSDFRIFNDSDFSLSKHVPNGEAGRRLQAAAEAQRDIIRRNLGFKTPFDEAKEQQFRRLNEWVEGSDPTDKTRQKAAKVVNWVREKDPLNTMRGYAFDGHLGFFNPASLPLHVSTAFATLATAGAKKGFEGLMSYPFTRMFLKANAGEDLLNAFVDRGVPKIMGFDDDGEFKAYMRQMKTSGFLDVNGSHQAINSYGAINAVSDVGNAWQNFREAGRFFFREGVLATRLAAFRVAWAETREELPKLAIDSAEFRTTHAGKAEMYGFNMSAQSAAWWQKGILSVPTQFFAYGARMLEAMLGKEFTGHTLVQDTKAALSGNLSQGAKRWRLIASQLALGGAAGLPLVSTLSQMYKNSTGSVARPDTLPGMMDRGLLDTLVYKLTGADVLAGKRFVAGKDIDENVQALFGLSSFGPKSLAEWAGGVSGGMAASAVSFMSPLFKYAIAESGGEMDKPPTSQDVVNLFKNISSVSSAMRSYMIWKYGTLYDSKGSPTATNLPSQDAVWTMAFGVNPGEVDAVHNMQTFLKNKDKSAFEAAQVIHNMRVEAFKHPDNLDDYTQQINMYVKMLPDSMRPLVWKKVRELAGKSDLYSDVSRKLQKDRARDQIISNQENQEPSGDQQ